MENEQDEQRILGALLDRLEAVYSEWEKNCPKTEPSYADASKVINRAIARVFCTDPERRNEIENELEALNPEVDFIDISVTPYELLALMLGLMCSIQSLEAKKYINESLGTGVSNEQRWSTAAEIMFIKEPGERLRPHTGDELIYYSVHIKRGAKPRKASEEVFKKYKFSSQGACDKWLRREIERRQREQQNGVPDFLAELPKPGTSPREK